MADRRYESAGVGSLNRITQETIEDEYRRQEQRNHEFAAAIELARLRRQQAMDEERARQKLAYENEAATALPELYAIKPGDPDAAQKHAEWGMKHSHLLDPEVGIKGAGTAYELLDRQIEGRAKQAASFQEKFEASAAAKEAERKAAEIRETDRKEAAKLADDNRRFEAAERAKERTAADTERNQATKEKAATALLENHEKLRDYAARRMDQMSQANPWLEQTTGLFTDDKDGKQRFGFPQGNSLKITDQEGADTLATPEKLRIYNEHRALQGDYDLHDKALADLRDKALKQDESDTGAPPVIPPASSTPPVNPNLTTPPPKLAPEDQQAIDWATANPDDPRSAKIKAMHGVK